MFGFARVSIERVNRAIRQDRTAWPTIVCQNRRTELKVSLCCGPCSSIRKPIRSISGRKAQTRSDHVGKNIFGLFKIFDAILHDSYTQWRRKMSNRCQIAHIGHGGSWLSPERFERIVRKPKLADKIACTVYLYMANQVPVQPGCRWLIAATRVQPSASQ